MCDVEVHAMSSSIATESDWEVVYGHNSLRAMGFASTIQDLLGGLFLRREYGQGTVPSPTPKYYIEHNWLEAEIFVTKDWWQQPIAILQVGSLPPWAGDQDICTIEEVYESQLVVARNKSERCIFGMWGFIP